MSSVLRVVPALAWMALIFTLSSRSTLPDAPGISDEIAAVAGHFVLYAVLSALLALARPPSSRLSRDQLVISAILAVAYGLTDELHQSFVNGRDASWFDLLVDLAGATAASVTLWLGPGRRSERADTHA